MAREQLIRDLMTAALDLHERKLWGRFTNRDCFAIRAPGIDHLLLAAVMGDGGEQHGLMVFQGANAVESFLALLDDDGPGDDPPDAMDMLSYSMSTFGDMDPSTQECYRSAGVHPRHDEQVPNILVKPSRRRLRSPSDEELLRLVAIVRATVSADRKKLLKPARADDPEGVCVISLASVDAEPAITVALEKLPAIAANHQRQTALVPDLSGLQVRDGTWLVGTPPMPAGIEGDNRSTLVLLVADDASGKVLHSKPFFSEQLQDAIDGLVEAFREKCHGIARTIVFSSRRLHDATAPTLKNAGAKCIFIPTIPKLQELAERMQQFFMQEPGETNGEQDEVPAASDLAGWKAADRRLSERFAEDFRSAKLFQLPRVSKQYFNDVDGQHFLQKHEQRAVVMAFSAWSVLDYRPTAKGKTRAEQMLADGLPKAEAILLRARMEAHPTIYRVVAHDPSAGTVKLEDMLLTGSVTVYDQVFSENIDDGLFLACRAFPAGNFHFFEVAGPPLAPGMGMEAIEFLRRSGLLFTRECLKRQANKFGWMWKWIDGWEANFKMPRLCNTDGEDLVFYTASFGLADPAAVRAALLKRPDIDHDAEADEFVWSRESGNGADMPGGAVTMGRIEFVGDEMVLTVNSTRRFEAARAWMAALPGVKFRGVTAQTMDRAAAEQPLDARISPPKPAKVTPDLARGMQQLMDKMYMEWIDKPVPALDDKTPRQACRTPAGRERVMMMIRTMPDPAGPAPVHVPRQAMLHELGLEAEVPRPTRAAAPQPTAPASSRKREKPGRNDQCPCGSGKKYKKCCGRE